MTEHERRIDIIKNSNVETFIQKIKSIPTYGAYKIAVEKGHDEKTDKFLAAMTMMYASCDDDFMLMMHSVSTDLLFAFADQKLRADILEEKKETVNESEG